MSDSAVCPSRLRALTVGQKVKSPFALVLIELVARVSKLGHGLVDGVGPKRPQCHPLLQLPLRREVLHFALGCHDTLVRIGEEREEGLLRNRNSIFLLLGVGTRVPIDLVEQMSVRPDPLLQLGR